MDLRPPSMDHGAEVPGPTCIRHRTWCHLACQAHALGVACTPAAATYSNVNVIRNRNNPHSARSIQFRHTWESYDLRGRIDVQIRNFNPPPRRARPTSRRRRFEDRDRGACWGARTRRATAPTRVSLCTSFGRSPRSPPPPAGGRTGSPECGRKQPNNEARARGPGRRRGPAERPARGRTRRAVRAPAARGERRKPETTCQVRARQHT